MADEMVKVRIRPLHGIGGYGEAGDEVMMRRDLAEMYEREGYVEFVAVSPASVISDDQQSAVSDQQSAVSPAAPAEEDHAVFKPETKRVKGKRGK